MAFPLRCTDHRSGAPPASPRNSHGLVAMSLWRGMFRRGNRGTPLQVPTSPEDLVEELDRRMRQDVLRMRRWRLFHRGLGLVGTLVLIVCPLLVANGLVRGDSTWGQVLLSSVAVAGALVTTFKPFLHSRKRRNDMNTMRALRDQFRAELAAAKGERAQLRTFAKYATSFASVYRARGDNLVDAELERDVLKTRATVEGDDRGTEGVP